MSATDEWLWGWDETPGIVSVWADARGRAHVWRRESSGGLVHEFERYRPWFLLATVDDLRGTGLRHRELSGPGALRFLVEAEDGRALADAILRGASRRLGRSFSHLRELGDDYVLALPPEEQYLVASGRTYFRGLLFDQLRRMQFDLETTGLDPDRDRIFLVALRDPEGRCDTLIAEGEGDADEADLIRRLCARIVECDPDVVENHNLHGFDLPFVVRRAELLGVPLMLGRDGVPGVRQRASRTNKRYTLVGRELIDTMDAVRRYDFSARDLPGHGLKAVARHFGLARDDRELIPGARIHHVFRSDPDRVRRYAEDDVTEAAGLARLLGGAAFALAQMVPRRYERLADAGAATGVIDPLLVRAYLRAGEALPRREGAEGVEHSGAALHLFASGVAYRVVKADVASLYPSLMCQYRIGPRRDRLGVLLAVVESLVERRLFAKAKAKDLPAGSPERHLEEALSAAMKLVVNSAYGYLGASSLTRFADVHAANEVTRRGREVLDLLCRELRARGMTLLEADTDGVYFAVPGHFEEADERRVVTEVGALLPSRVKLEFEGRYRAMLSHEPKNYALLPYGEGSLVLRGVAFRSSRAEPFGERFLRTAVEHLLRGDVVAVRRTYLATVDALRGRALPTFDVTSRVRLTKSPEEYFVTRGERRELPYEAMLSAGRTHWTSGERARVYRATGGRAALFSGADDEAPTMSDPRDYDVDYYVRVLVDSFAARLARALVPEHFAATFADPEQLPLFPVELSQVRPVLNLA